MCRFVVNRRSSLDCLSFPLVGRPNLFWQGAITFAMLNGCQIFLAGSKGLIKPVSGPESVIAHFHSKPFFWNSYDAFMCGVLHMPVYVPAARTLACVSPLLLIKNNNALSGPPGSSASTGHRPQRSAPGARRLSTGHAAQVVIGPDHGFPRPSLHIKFPP